MKNFLINIKLHLLEFCYMVIHQMGFDSISDLYKSLFNIKLLIYSSNIVMVMGILSKFSTDYLGLAGIISFSFLLLVILQFITGLFVAGKKSEKIEERKLLRIVVRIVIYSLLMFIMNAFTHFPPIDIIGFTFNIWGYLYHFGISLIIFQLLISVAKNLSLLGFDEMKVFGEFLGRKLNALIQLDKNKTDQLLNKDNGSDKKV